eukprot:1876194-Pleurochrysis_carterae.AAC.1
MTLPISSLRMNRRSVSDDIANIILEDESTVSVNCTRGDRTLANEETRSQAKHGTHAHGLADRATR